MASTDRENLFRDLLDSNQARWAGIARAYAETAGDRDDLLQEIALEVWKSLDSFDGRAAVATWAYRVALNTALAWRRRSQRRAGRLPIAPAEVEQLGGDGESPAIRVLEEFLSSLSRADRAVMLLHLDAVPNSEAAEVLGMSEGAFRVRLHRLRKRFEEAYVDREVTDDV